MRPPGLPPSPALSRPIQHRSLQCYPSPARHLAQCLEMARERRESNARPWRRPRFDNTDFHVSHRQPLASTSIGIRQALLENDSLDVVRHLEMLNIFIGYEQANRYAIRTPAGQDVGYLVEEDSLIRSLFRNFLRTRRPLTALIMDVHGKTILKLRRPFSIVNSRIYVTDIDNVDMGLVQQEWHPWRRRYNLFMNSASSHSGISIKHGTTETVVMKQFGRIDAGFLSWDFSCRDERGGLVFSIDRNFSGLARELFTDTGHYRISWKSASTDPSMIKVSRALAIERLRAVSLAAAITIDFDYFTRVRGGLFGSGIGGGFIWTGSFGGGGDGSDEN